ncbi:hypothetical protein KW800_02820, partial [Candidatus Parcubacteria bacterium]|nr:hypothetical protein [Candidatus Parcubacteria bacterium]
MTNKFNIRHLAFAALLVICHLAFAAPVHAAFNAQVNYQGRLITPQNVAVTDGSYNMRFNLYTAASGTAAIWTETLTGTNRVEVTKGLFSIMLGSTTPFTGVDFNQTLYLGVEIGGSDSITPVWDGEMSPRKVIGAVPAAFVAQNVVGNIASTTYATSTHATSTSLFSSIGTFTDLFVNNYEQNNGTFSIISTIPTGDIFSV